MLSAYHSRGRFPRCIDNAQFYLSAAAPFSNNIGIRTLASMAEKSTINEEEFETLLRWLDPDRETAGQKYEDIRILLVKMFLARGCPWAEELADETIDRVIKRSVDIVDEYQGDPKLYFYGVAQKVFLESTRKPRHQELPAVLIAEVSDADDRELDAKDECLKECLEKLVPAQRELIISYYDYRGTKRAKIDRRREINQALGVTPELMRIRIFRIRAGLQNCIRDCFEKKLAKLSEDFVIDK
jgi:DNA-directed RNA polymerase specialized sigma24 family protein